MHAHIESGTDGTPNALFAGYVDSVRIHSLIAHEDNIILEDSRTGVGDYFK